VTNSAAVAIKWSEIYLTTLEVMLESKCNCESCNSPQFLYFEILSQIEFARQRNDPNGHDVITVLPKKY
jgi:hypothetical protein